MNVIKHFRSSVDFIVSSSNFALMTTVNLLLFSEIKIYQCLKNLCINTSNDST